MAAHDREIVAAIVVAAGSGSRLGSAVPKAFVEVAGKPLLAHAAAPFLAHEDVRDLVVVAPAELVESAAALVPAATVVPGGATRQQSVDRGLAAIEADVTIVLVHDAARAFVPAEVISRVLAALADGAHAVIPTLPVIDTIKQVDAAGRVVGTPSRDALRAVQTPQGFRRDLLVAAHARDVTEAPDDASLVEALGVAVVVVDGHEDAFKITVAADLDRAEALAAGSPA